MSVETEEPNLNDNVEVNVLDDVESNVEVFVAVEVQLVLKVGEIRLRELNFNGTI